MTLLKDLKNLPEDLRKLSQDQLPELALELREEIINIVSKNGGHLGASLGVVELTIAIHYVFNTPEDILIWDVGHQSYAHKILTGRGTMMHTLRKAGGISGFTKRCESPYDPFGAGHSSTSISAALGMAAARKLNHQKHNIICVIGDGAMSAGMAYEALNNIEQNKIIIILNDNNMSISPPVGAMSAYLAKLISGNTYNSMRNIAKQITSLLPENFKKTARYTEDYIKKLATGDTIFSKLGCYYIGPINGHDFTHLLPLLNNVRNVINYPVLIHTITKKGKGYPPAENSTDKFHGVTGFNVKTGIKHQDKKDTYSLLFAKTLTELARNDKKIIAITAAMAQNTGLSLFAEHFPDRFFDVGIAEQHAVTFAAGLAAQNFKPFVAIYSSFLQRSVDQIIHDVALQKLPVRFAIDRAGFVGADGPTHAGTFDISYLAYIPEMILMAAADANDLKQMIKLALSINNKPCAFRYPREQIFELPILNAPLIIGKGVIVQKGKELAIINYGSRLKETLKAAEKLKKYNIFPTIFNARFAKPIDCDIIIKLATEHRALITIEAGSICGFGSLVLKVLMSAGILDTGIKIKNMTIPDMFIAQNEIDKMYDIACLNCEQIVSYAISLLKR